MSDSDRDRQQQEHGQEQPPRATSRGHVREMEEYLRRVGERLRQLDEQLSHLETEDDRAVDRGRGVALRGQHFLSGRAGRAIAGAPLYDSAGKPFRMSARLCICSRVAG